MAEIIPRLTTDTSELGLILTTTLRVSYSGSLTNTTSTTIDNSPYKEGNTIIVTVHRANTTQEEVYRIYKVILQYCVVYHTFAILSIGGAGVDAPTPSTGAKLQRGKLCPWRD